MPGSPPARRRRFTVRILIRHDGPYSDPYPGVCPGRRLDLGDRLRVGRRPRPARASGDRPDDGTALQRRSGGACPTSPAPPLARAVLHQHLPRHPGLAHGDASQGETQTGAHRGLPGLPRNQPSARPVRHREAGRRPGRISTADNRGGRLDSGALQARHCTQISRSPWAC